MRLSQKIGKTLIAAALLAVILAGAFITLLFVSEGIHNVRPSVYRYSDALETTPSKPEIAAMLATLGQDLKPSDLALLRQKLAGVVQVNLGNDLIDEYTGTLFDLSGNLSQIQTQLQAARSYLNTGNRAEALVLVGQLEQRRDQSETLLQSSNVLLRQIGEQYQIDTTSQVTGLNTLSQLYQQDSAQIDQLRSDLKTQTVVVQTSLTLNSSARAAFVGQSFRVYGNLKTSNGTALENRTITISWESYHVVVESTFDGYFEGNVSFPAGSSAGSVTITADYGPSAADKLLYAGSTAQLEVQLFYEPTAITAKVGPTSARPLSVVDVWGNLSSSHNHRPLENRTIVIRLDGTALGNATTDKSGNFFYYFYVPRTTSNGTHTIKTEFNATTDIFAPSNASLSLNIEILASQSSFLIDRGTILSGTKLAINGTIRYANTTYSNQTAPPSGNVTIYLDNSTIANVTLNSQGSFTYEMQVPLGTSFGSHSIFVEYYPDKPWIQTSQSTVNFNVINTPLVVLAASVIAISSVLATYTARRRKRTAVASKEAMILQAIAAQRAGIAEEFSRNNLIAALEIQTSASSKIKTAYGLAQFMISKTLGVDLRPSETPSEFLLRISGAEPSLKGSLDRIVELYELAEYSPYPLQASDAVEVSEVLLKVREQLQNVKNAEDLKR